ncbi:MAG: lactonase family protein [Opitutaceae bacterium]|jgi:DNA-binding beta-propeller fold protein YncE|nr:lactonase family protein [Opitutaceae bacterium]
MKTPFPRCIVIAVLSLACVSNANAEGLVHAIVVANDEGVVYNSRGESAVREGAGPGSVTAVVFSGEIPRVSTVAGVPASLTGAPVSIALHPRLPLLIVTAAMRRVMDGGGAGQAPDNRVSLLRMESGVLTRVATLEVGSQPSGVSFSPDGSLAYVANRNEGSVSIIEVDGGAMKERARVTLAEKDASLTHVQISPDGRRALATLNNTDEILFLAIDSRGAPVVAQRIKSGKGPYAARFSPDGRAAVVAHIWSNEIVFFSVGDDSLHETGRMATARIPEGIDISRDGEWLAVNCLGGFGLTDAANPAFGTAARVYLLQREGGKYVPRDEMSMPDGPQFAVFTPSGKHLAVAGTGSKKLRLFDCEGGRLRPSHIDINLPSEPAAAHRL